MQPTGATYCNTDQPCTLPSNPELFPVTAAGTKGCTTGAIAILTNAKATMPASLTSWLENRTPVAKVAWRCAACGGEERGFGWVMVGIFIHTLCDDDNI